MIKFVSVTAATRAIIDKESQKLSLIDVLEDSKSNNFPYLYPNLTYVVFMTKDPGDEGKGEFTVTLESGAKVIVENAVVKYDFNSSSKNKCLVNIQGVPVESPCKINFSAKVKMDKVIEHSVEITSVTKTQVS